MKSKFYMKNTENIHVGSRTHIQSDRIVMIQADINYSLIYLLDGNKVVVSTCLKKLESRFSTISSFARVHKSFLVNLDYIKEHQKGRFLLENDLSCEVSRRKYKKLVEQNKIDFM